MNRKKKVKQTLLKQAKKARAKKAGAPGKPRYISKAERAAMAENAPEPTTVQDDQAE